MEEVHQSEFYLLMNISTKTEQYINSQMLYVNQEVW